jgi:hypothetical protein
MMDEGFDHEQLRPGLHRAGHWQDVGHRVLGDNLHRFLAGAGVRPPNQDAVMQWQRADLLRRYGRQRFSRACREHP